MTLKDQLGAAVTTFDRREEEKAARSKRGYHNRYALGQYLLRVDEICADVERGASPRAAIIAAYDGRLRDFCLKAIGEPKAEPNEESRGLFYVPAST
jgi:hypothetical protein